jgi:Flp pilus assembly protein TadD
MFILVLYKSNEIQSRIREVFMTFFRALFAPAVAASAIILIQPAAANTTNIIMKGTITMIDGSVPPKGVGLQRLCSDGASPGPLADKQGNFTWQLALDPMVQRACWIEATLDGFSSSRFEIGSIPLATFTGAGVFTLPTLVLSPKDSGELTNVIMPAESSVPGKASNAWKLVEKSLRADNEKEAITHLQEAVQAAPKFAEGWNLLGALYERDHAPDKARDALQHAIDNNPKMLSPYLRLARVYDELGDWDAAAKAADSLLKVDKRFYPEVYLHQAIARVGLKDLAGAESSINTELMLDVSHKYPRAEYVLGRILQAKGDIDGARDHINKYLKMDPGVLDSSQIKVLLDYLGKPGAPAIETGLERPF